MSKKLKKYLIRIIVSLILFIILFIIDKTINLSTVLSIKNSWILPLILYFIVYIIIGYDIIIKAFLNILHGQVLDENFLMFIASLGAFGLAIYRGINNMPIEGFDEACAVLIFYQFGEFFQTYATGKSRKSIADLMDIRPEYANLKINNQIIKVDPNEVKIADTIVVKPGEKVPLDGIVIKGKSCLDMKALTGESKPIDINVNDKIISGSINITSKLEIKVEKQYDNSTVAKILELVENAANKKSKAENFITKFAKYYTPIVVLLAILLILIPGIITSYWSTWIYRGLSFLVVSCPCALVISIPLTFFSGIGTASKNHILVKGSAYLEKFNQANIFVFDKTGTLTKGNFEISKIEPEEKKQEILYYAAIAEQNSNHPIANSIYKKYGKKIQEDYEIKEIQGQGIIATNNKNVILCGNEKLMIENNIPYQKVHDVNTVVYVALNNKFLGSILISDVVKNEAKEVINYLNEKKYKTIMLTGDNEQIASQIATKLNLQEYKASLLPQQKVEEVENLLKNKNKNEVLCFVGDGINDAPVLVRSDIGVAMGNIGSDAAIEASDIVLMEDNLKGLVLAKKIASKTMKIVKQNIVFSIGVKLLILILSALGITNMWIAVFGDVGVAFLAILNALRVNSNYNNQKE